MSYSSKTEYNKIFENTYWGKFSLQGRKEEDIKELEEVVKNRNQFVKDYDIKKIVLKKPVKLREYITNMEKSNVLDHVEVYEQNNNNYLILNSPYDPDEKKVPDMEKVYKLYNHAKSFIKIVKRDELKRNNKKDYMNAFYGRHQELKKNDIICDVCGLPYKYFNKTKHLKTKLHNYALNTGCKFMKP